MKIYFDVSCLNRPFDDQRQTRVRLEAEAVTLIFEKIDAGPWRQVSSQIAEIEITAMPDVERRRRVRALLPARKDRIRLTPRMFSRAAQLGRLGFQPADALHIAAAEALKPDVMLTCDDRLYRRAKRFRSKLGVRVDNPLLWLKEEPDAPNT
ncbi:MAG: PIN domain-containing protein [Phycisphaerae bacterium]